MQKKITPILTGIHSRSEIPEILYKYKVHSGQRLSPDRVLYQGMIEDEPILVGATKLDDGRYLLKVGLAECDCF